MDLWSLNCAFRIHFLIGNWDFAGFVTWMFYTLCAMQTLVGELKTMLLPWCFFSLDKKPVVVKATPKKFDGNWMLDEAFTVKMMKIGKCPLKNWNQLCLTRTWQWTESFVELLAIAVGHLCQAMFMGLRFFLYVMFLMSWRSFVKWQHTHFICTRIMLPFFPLSKLPLFWVLWGFFCLRIIMVL